MRPRNIHVAPRGGAATRPRRRRRRPPEFRAAQVGETTRARAVFELAVAQPELDHPEQVWKAFVDLEIHLERHPDDEDGDGDGEDADAAAAVAAAGSRAAALYERLLERTQHVKVWLSYAAFLRPSGSRATRPPVVPRGLVLGETAPPGFFEPGEGLVAFLAAGKRSSRPVLAELGRRRYEADAARDAAAAGAERRGRARAVYGRANDSLKGAADEDRVALLDAWRGFEAAARAAGDDAALLETVEGKVPRKVKRKRPRADDPDASEEYYAFVFPDDAAQPVNLKILEMAKKWKQAEQAKKQRVDG